MLYGIAKYTKTGICKLLPKTYIRLEQAEAVLKQVQNINTEKGFRFTLISISATGSKNQ